MISNFQNPSSRPSYITVFSSLFFDSVFCFISEDHKFLCTKGGGYSPDVDFPTGKNTEKESMYKKHRFFLYVQNNMNVLCTVFFFKKSACIMLWPCPGSIQSPATTGLPAKRH